MVGTRDLERLRADGLAWDEAVMIERPFRVLGLQQIAVGGTDKSALRALWVDLLGLEPHGAFQSEKENVDEDILRLGTGPFAVGIGCMLTSSSTTFVSSGTRARSRFASSSVT